MKPRKLSRLTAILIAALLPFAFGATAGLAGPLDWFGAEKPPPTPAEAPPPAPAVTEPHVVAPSFTEVARVAKPSVVNVSTTQKVHASGSPDAGQLPQDPFFDFFRHFQMPQPHDFTQRSLGSGVIVRPDGYVVTNAHVVKNADEIVIKLHDERELKAKVVGIDEKTDIALLHAEGASGLPVATLGNSDRLQVGEWVVAIGNPFGLSETVTAGIVSAKGRSIGAGPYDDFIQTDASINPGNSGGPLLDLEGRVVGINSAIFSQSGGNIGIGFAIPIDLVKHVVEQLSEHGKVVRGWLGVVIQDVTPDLARSFDLERPEGALVSEAMADGPAAHAGIERGDVIVEYNGTKIDHLHGLPSLVADTPVGKKVEVVVLRGGKKKTFDVTVGEMPAEPGEAAGETSGDWGLTVQDITPELAQRLELESTEGVLVSSVAPDSPAAEAGVRPGDVILQVNRKPVHGTSDYEKALAGGKGNSLLLLLQREGHSLFTVLQRRG
jgi:serine protease Do